MSNLKSNAEVRDAVMLYATQVHELKGEKLAFVVSRIYSRGFLMDLKGIREKLKMESEPLYALDMLKGIDRPGKEDQDLLGEELKKLIDEKILPNFYDPNEPL